METVLSVIKQESNLTEEHDAGDTDAFDRLENGDVVNDNVVFDPVVNDADMPTEGPQELEDNAISSINGVQHNESILNCSFVHEDPSSSSELTEELHRVKAELAEALMKNSELTRNLNAAEQQVLMSNRQLENEKEKFAEEQNRTEVEIARLQTAIEKETKEKMQVQDNFKKFRDSVTDLSGDFLELNEQLQEHFIKCCKNPNRLDEESAKCMQDRLDNLTLFTQDKFQVWTTEQIIMQEELAKTKDTLEDMNKVLESHEKFQEQEEKNLVIVSVSSAAEPTVKTQPIFEESAESDLQLKSMDGLESEISSETVPKQDPVVKVEQDPNQFSCHECGSSYMTHAILYRHQKMAHTKPTFIWSAPKKDQAIKEEAVTLKKKPCPTTKPASSPTSSDSDDSDIMIIESDTPAKPIPSKPADNRPVFKLMSKLALSFAKPATSSSSVSILPSEGAPGASIVPIKVIQRKPQASFSGKRHSRDITKRHRGFYCTCSIKFISRRRLDAHINFHNVTKLSTREKTSAVNGNCNKVFMRKSRGAKKLIRRQQSAGNTDDEQDSPPVSPKAIPIPLEIPVPKRHKVDYSKSPRRGFFCTCGLKYKNKKKLNNHIRLRANKENSEQKKGADEDASFTCMTCGESFHTNTDRISHRMQAHGHGLY